jgi:hypothetical protein
LLLCPHDLKTFADRLQTVGMMSDFYAGILVAWQLDGIKFALGPSIATTRARLSGFGGYAAIENSPGDDLLVGRLIAEQGYEVKLLRYAVSTVSDYGSMSDLFTQADALDRGDAAHASVGPLRAAADARAAVVAGGVAVHPGWPASASGTGAGPRIKAGLSWFSGSAATHRWH